MSTLRIAGRDLAFNKKGLLASFEEWGTSVAEALAEDEGLHLSECHWKVIHFLREYYGTHEMPPSPKVIINAIGTELSADVPCTRRHRRVCFRTGGASKPAASPDCRDITVTPAEPDF